MYLRTAMVILAAFMASLAICQWTFAASRQGRPNILLIVADDLGYADLGAYGSDIETPNIDALAARGLLFTQFHTSPFCSPTRAMLLSGNNNHVAGVASQQRDGLAGVAVEGYEASLSDRIVPFPRLLQQAGYDTYTVGKWHLGLEADNSPHAAGFSRAYNLLQGGGSHFDDTGFENGKSLYRENAALATYPAGRYSTELYTDKLIGFIESDLASERPFFAFAAYTSPHWPLQVPDDYLDRYAGHYDDGYDALRERRFKTLQQAGIVPAGSTLPPRNEAVTPWQDLDAEQQKIESRKMELYAAMVDNLDDHVGRLVDYLRERGLFDNTLIIFMSDNGASAEDFYDGLPSAAFRDYLQTHYDNSYEKMGTAESFVSYGRAWGEAGSAPFRRHKGYALEGGVVAPMIAAGPGIAGRGEITPAYLTVMDLAPTFLEIAGAKYPQESAVRPMLGESLVPFLGGDTDRVHDDNYVTVISHRGRTLVRKGSWKIVVTEGPFGEGKFELYNLRTDPGETTDLRNAEPDIFADLLETWRTERLELGIILPQDL